MDLSKYFAIFLLFLVGVYVLQICSRDLREARKSGKGRPYRSMLLVGLVLGVIGIVLLMIVWWIVGPIH